MSAPVQIRMNDHDYAVDFDRRTVIVRVPARHVRLPHSTRTRLQPAHWRQLEEGSPTWKEARVRALAKVAAQQFRAKLPE